MLRETAEGYFLVGTNKRKLGDTQGAIADYNKAIAINPQNANSYNNRGIAKSNLKDYQGAIADYNKAIEIDPQLAVAYNNRGLAKYSLNGYQGVCVDCCADWRKSLSLGNKDIERMFAVIDLALCRNMRSGRRTSASF